MIERRVGQRRNAPCPHGPTNHTVIDKPRGLRCAQPTLRAHSIPSYPRRGIGNFGHPSLEPQATAPPNDTPSRRHLVTGAAVVAALGGATAEALAQGAPSSAPGN